MNLTDLGRRLLYPPAVLSGTRRLGFPAMAGEAGEPGALPGFAADDSRSWVDPLVGANLRYIFTGRCYAVVPGDVGGFGVGSDQTWSVYGGVGCRFADWISMTLGYQYLHHDFQGGGFVSKLNVQGLLLGVGFHF